MHPPRIDAAPGVGRHRRPEPYAPRHRLIDAAVFQPRTTTRRRSATLLMVMALAAVSASGSAAAPPPDNGASSVAVTAEGSAASARLSERRAAAEVSSRAAPREAAPPTQALAQAPPPAPPAAQPRAVEASARPAPPPEPTPVGGLTQQQMDHAAVIVAMGQRAGLPERAFVVAIATALQETYLRNLANPVYPESLSIPNDGVGYDHDSVGLFQQRPSTGWGSVSQIMDPAYSATKFYEALARVPGWEGMPVTVAAQRVQISAFPDHYAKHEPLARKIVDALT